MGLEQLKRSLDEKINANCFKDSGRLKKNNKPLMERFRRRKINNYLEELKHLVLSALNKEVSLYSKMEKADILDMAVRYIKAIRTHPECSTTYYRQTHEDNTNAARSYEIPSPIPFQARTDNVNYYNSDQPPKEIVGHSIQKENCSQVENTNVQVETSCQTKANEQFQSAPNEQATIEIHNINSMNSSVNSSENARIWRPW